MNTSVNYSYTQDDLNKAYSELAPVIFNVNPAPSDENASPKMLVVAGAQGSGKSYLLDKSLIPSGKYDNYIRLYRLEDRQLHPQYLEMIEHGVLHAYKHTESFIWELGQKIFTDAFSKKYNIIMETALDSPDFAAFPAVAASNGYQFEVHLIGCKREFSHVSTIERGLKSIETGELERFVDMSAIDDSMANAQSILNAFENACATTVGSTITLFERGFGALRDRRVVCSSLCQQLSELTPQPVVDHDGSVIAPKDQAMRILKTPTANKPCAFNNYAKLVNAPISSLEERGETLKASHIALAKAERANEKENAKDKIPYGIFNDLYAYTVKYVFR